MIVADINTSPFTKYDIEMVRGDSKKITLKIMDGAEVVDLSSWTDFYLTVDTNRAPADSTTNVVQLLGTVVELLLGEHQVEFTPDVGMEAGSYYFDIQATDSDLAITTLVMGKYKLIQDITKD